MSHADDVKARWEDPEMQTGAERRARLVNARLKASGIANMAKKLQGERLRSRKVVWLNMIVRELDAAMKDVAPCKDGCSACCHMAVSITPQEAEALAKASKRKPQQPSAEALRATDAMAVDKYSRVPCPFLMDNRCSVYQARPFACKMHYSMDKDSLLCQITDDLTIRAPSLDTQKYLILNLLTYHDPLNIQFADIRDYFP